MVIGSEPPARTRTSMPSASRIVRSKVRFSTGGAPLSKLRSGSADSSQAIASAKHGERQDEPEQSARSDCRPRRGLGAGDGVTASFMPPPPPTSNMPDPAELGELGLVRVEHVEAGLVVLVGELEDAALRLALHDQVDRLQRRRQRRALVVIVEEIGVQVERVDRVELDDVDQVDADRPAADDPDRPLHVGVRDRVDGIDLVLAVEIGVEGVHHHHEFLPVGVLGRAEQPRAGDVGLLGVAGRIGIDDEGAVHALVDVPLQRQRMAMIEVAAERLGVELVDELLARTDQPGARHAVHARRSGCRGNASNAGASRSS